MNPKKTQADAQTDARRVERRLRGISELVVAILMIVVAVVAVFMLWNLVFSKWMKPAGGIDLELDPSSVLTGKVASIVVVVQSAADAVKNPQVTIIDPSTGSSIASCQITSSGTGGSSGSSGGSGVYVSGDKITATCTANSQFYSGYQYIVQVTVTDANTGATFTKSFTVTAS
jgi:uncharacterized membrane protein YgcG